MERRFSTPGYGEGGGQPRDVHPACRVDEARARSLMIQSARLRDVGEGRSTTDRKRQANMCCTAPRYQEGRHRPSLILDCVDPTETCCEARIIFKQTRKILHDHKRRNLPCHRLGRIRHDRPLRPYNAMLPNYVHLLLGMSSPLHDDAPTVFQNSIRSKGFLLKATFFKWWNDRNETS